MKSNKNIVLVGMMGSGKSLIGKILSKKTDRQLIDIDQKIEEVEKMTISEIFDKFGEKKFRSLEQKISIYYLKKYRKIISLGGGGFINPRIRNFCLKQSLTFWLDWKSDTIINRIKKNKKRPLAIKLDRNRLNKLIRDRSKIYLKSDFRVNCDKLSKSEIVNLILENYKKNGNQNKY
tara:strand:+ start:551 stop:1081 length:531 start_codon:yes stop_codon:yes gene_type:complete